MRRLLLNLHRHAALVAAVFIVILGITGSVMAFGFDITNDVRQAPQENILAVRIDNSWDYREKATNARYEWNDRNFYANYGGINKNVFLHITDKLHQTLPLYSNLGTTGVYVYAQDFDINNRSAKVTAEAEVKNENAEPKKFSYEVALTDADGKLMQTIQGGESCRGLAS